MASAVVDRAPPRVTLAYSVLVLKPRAVVSTAGTRALLPGLLGLLERDVRRGAGGAHAKSRGTHWTSHPLARVADSADH